MLAVEQCAPFQQQQHDVAFIHRSIARDSFERLTKGQPVPCNVTDGELPKPPWLADRLALYVSTVSDQFCVERIDIAYVEVGGANPGMFRCSSQ